MKHMPWHFRNWDEVGASEAEKIGYVDGKESGFTDNIQEFKDEEYERGILEESEYFNTHSVLVAKNIDISSNEKRFFPGSVINLSLDVINFGKLDSIRGEARVELIAVSDNVTILSNGQVPLTSIPKETQARVNNIIEAKIAKTSAPGEILKFKVIVRNSDGTKAEFYIEKTVQLHVGVEMSIQTNKKPNAVRFLGYRPKHKVIVSLKNVSRTENLDKEFKVELSSSFDLDITKSVVMSGVLLAHSVKKLELKYRFKTNKYKGATNKIGFKGFLWR